MVYGEQDLLIMDMEELQTAGDVIDSLNGGNLALVNGVGRVDGLPDGFLYECIPLELKKQPLSERSYMALFHRELIWFYSADRETRRLLRAFAIEREMKHTGFTLSLVRHTFQEEAMLAEKQMQSKAWLLAKEAVDAKSLRCEKLENVLSKTLSGLAGTMAPAEMRHFLKGFTDIDSYLEILSILKKKYTVILAVKDTPGDMLPADVVESIHKMGFVKFKKGLWQMYVGVAKEGCIISDKSGLKPGAAVEFNDEKMNLVVKSMAWRRGNAAQIVINGTDWAVNIRGLNIVVYDYASDTVLDSVGYDGHQMSGKFLRKNLSSVR